MNTRSKEVYYRGIAIKPSLAARYFSMLPAEGRLLDVGCGLGSFGAHKPPGIEVHGLDIDPGAVELARQHELALVHDVGVGSLPYEDGFFDGALAKDILEHLLHPSILVQEIARVLRPGGAVVASVVMATPKAVWADYTHIRGFTAASARMMFEDCGLPVEAVWPMGGVPLSSRLGLIDLVPALLKLPPARWLWGSSWELLARKPVSA